MSYKSYAVGGVDRIFVPDISEATPSEPGLFSAADKQKLNSLVTGGLRVCTNANRPNANAVDAVFGTNVVAFWNTDDAMSGSPLNFSDGMNWYDIDGNLT